MRAASLNPVQIQTQFELTPSQTCVRNYATLIIVLLIFNLIAFIFQVCYLFISRA